MHFSIHVLCTYEYMLDVWTVRLWMYLGVSRISPLTVEPDFEVFHAAGLTRIEGDLGNLTRLHRHVAGDGAGIQGIAVHLHDLS